ncbi:MAG: hypothetical protein BWX86_02881 [Verrucomicrobia bacterium ADurb.Bin122]|nr:MAG: hypothetical protein BWX86_02881 [Verrucomicrobia bacterium ADurb.Bin122]
MFHLVRAELELEQAADEVVDDEGAEVADVRRRIDRRPAVVEAVNAVGVRRAELSVLAGNRFVETDGHAKGGRLREFPPQRNSVFRFHPAEETCGRHPPGLFGWADSTPWPLSNSISRTVPAACAARPACAPSSRRPCCARRTSSRRYSSSMAMARPSPSRRCPASSATTSTTSSPSAARSATSACRPSTSLAKSTSS